LKGKLSKKQTEAGSNAGLLLSFSYTLKKEEIRSSETFHSDIHEVQTVPEMAYIFRNMSPFVATLPAENGVVLMGMYVSVTSSQKRVFQYPGSLIVNMTVLL
jgi:hypothetical protein